MLTPQTKFPICTIANTPRLPEHCIEWASVLEWPKVFKDLKLDGDNPDHIQWLFDQASNRAKTFSIEGVTWSLTQGVVKNIIPAIASTNAIIAASCCNEAFKIATNSAPFLQNYMMYTGNDSVYTFTFKHERKPDCQVCGDSDKDPIRLDVSKSSTLEELIDLLIESPNFQLKHPSISRAKDREPIYFQNPEQLRLLTELNLEKSLEELFTCKGVEDEKRMVIDKGDNDEEELYENNLIVVTDVTLPFSMKIQLKLN
uniref:NEDD8-activating enzyme E1 catalytic subunit n=1 Tax=Phakopsora pachyrhizi TaxID=170000 RepID=A0A0S1MIX8_PHAPC